MNISLKSIKTKVEEYSCQCGGRNYRGEEVFDFPVDFSLTVSEEQKMISANVYHCPYKIARGECKAQHPHINKGVSCPYVFDLPSGESFLLEHKQERVLANKDLAKIASKEGSLLHPWKHLFE